MVTDEPPQPQEAGGNILSNIWENILSDILGKYSIKYLGKYSIQYLGKIFSPISEENFLSNIWGCKNWRYSQN